MDLHAVFILIAPIKNISIYPIAKLMIIILVYLCPPCLIFGHPVVSLVKLSLPVRVVSNFHLEQVVKHAR